MYEVDCNKKLFIKNIKELNSKYTFGNVKFKINTIYNLQNYYKKIKKIIFLKIFFEIFFENFLKLILKFFKVIFQSHFSTQFQVLCIALFCAYFDNRIIST